MLNDDFDFVPEMPDLDEALLPIIPLDHDTGMMTMRPYQQEAVDAVFDKLQEHRSTLVVLPTGCVAGDTVIGINRGGKGYSRDIRRAFRAKSDGRVDSTIPTMVRVCVGSRIGLHQSEDIVFSGHKETHSLLLANGKSVRATPDHEVLTENGFVALAGLSGADRIVCEAAPKTGRSPKPKRHYQQVSGLLFHPYAGRARSLRRTGNHVTGRMYRVPLHRLVAEATMNGVTVDYLIDQCRQGPHSLTCLDPVVFAVHHRNNNPLDNRPENLQVLTHSDHNALHGSTDKLANLGYGDLETSVVSSIERHGIEETYDVICQDPHRNFVANGIVVHNCGKTVCFAEIAYRWPHGRVLVMAHREELIQQAADKIGRHTDERPSIEMGARKESRHGHGLLDKSKVLVTSVQTMSRPNRMKHFSPRDFSLIITDEIHHGVSASYRKVYEYFYSNPQLRHVGVTATPNRADESALGDIMESVAYTMGIREAIDEGWLVDIEQKLVVIESLDFSEVRTTAGDFNQKDLASVMMGSLEAEQMMAEESPVHKIVSATIQEAQGRPTLIFCVTKAHAEMTCEICQRHPGVTAEFVTDDTPPEIRTEIVKRFRAGLVQILCGCTIFTEGFDARVDVVAMARPTKSTPFYIQCIGRGTRPLDGLVDKYDTADERREAIANSVKPCVTVLDFCGSSGRHKLVTAVDVLGGNYTEDIIEAAKRRLRESGETKEIDELLAEEALAAAERKAKAQKLAQEQKERDAAAKVRAEEERLKRQAEWNTRKGIRGHATYRTEAVSAFERVTIPEQVGIGVHRGGCSDGQVKFLMRLGVTEQEACRYSKGQAGTIIDKLSKQTGGDYIMPFTKHMGRKLRDIPSGYLDWAEKNISDPKIHAEIMRFRQEELAAIFLDKSLDKLPLTPLSDEPTPF